MKKKGDTAPARDCGENTAGDAWDKKASLWISDRRRKEDPFLRRTRWVARMVKKHARGRLLLDVGCGDGSLLGMMLDDNFDVYGCDVSRRMVEETKSFLRPRLADVDRRIVVNTADSLPFNPVKFDVITAIGVLPYIENWGDFLRLLHGRLTSNGCLIASWTNPRSFYAAVHILRSFSNTRLEFFRNPGCRKRVLNLYRTGIPSGGYLSFDKKLQPRGNRGFAKLAESAGLCPSDRFSWNHIKMIDSKFDPENPEIPTPRSRWAWTQVEVLKKSNSPGEAVFKSGDE